MTHPLASIVIPAHNEESVITRCLRVLTEGAREGELDVIVVANGCTDGTADAARAAGVTVIDTDRPGKRHALGLGDAECAVFPRVYLDADVDLDVRSVRTMVAELDRTGALACSPLPEYDVRGVSGAARRFHRVLDALLGGRRGLSGAGVYVLTEPGHARVFPLPDVLADDGYVHRSFAPGERLVVRDARSVVRPARTIAAVVRRRARVRLGNQQLDRLGRPAAEGQVGLGQLIALVRARRVGPVDAAGFVGVLVIERLVARWRRLRGSDSEWAGDRSSR